MLARLFRSRCRVGLALPALLVATGVDAMTDRDLPLAPPRDAVMATPQELGEMAAWFSVAFAGRQPGGALPLTVRRQDHSVLRYGRSCIDTPLRIGGQSYEHGLGTHAVSEIAVALPAGARRFEAAVGIDHNDDTGGARGSVVFSVEADGRELFRSDVCRGGMAPVEVRVELPAGAKELLLKVGDAGDGPSHDQADWAAARVVLADGHVQRLDEGQADTLSLPAGPPFSFVYGGRPSAELLPGWQRVVGEPREEGGWTARTVSWQDPATGLKVTAEARLYREYPAAEWTVYLENTGAKDTPIIEQLQGLDLTLRSGYQRTPLRIRQLHGDACAESSWLPFTTELAAGKSYRMAPAGGRPASVSASPWFNLEYAELGLIVAVGWTGQWAAHFDRAGTGPTRLRVGQEQTHFVLHPGERVRTPRLLVHHWRQHRLRAHQQFRRLMLFQIMPKANGRPVRLPLAIQCFDRYVGRPEWSTEAGQLAYVEAASKLGFDAVWLDAAWFPGGFPNGVGSWRAEPKQFPRGLKPVADACHAKGLQFIVWFEPERVAPDSDITREHPEFVHGGAKGGLFKLDDPAARAWLTDLLSQRIREYGIDVYRNDFNTDPLGWWRQADAPDRQGITEIRYVEGLYALWDELLRRHPGLVIDNCASGGRRIDLEMCARSVPLWRSDTGCSPGHPEYNQMQSCALGLYVPMFTIGLWDPVAYQGRSTATGGAPIEAAYLEPTFDWDQARAGIAEIDANRKYWYGDLYPLTPVNTDLEQFAAWQLHRADLDAGIVLAFRRRESSYAGLILALQGIRPDRRYEVTWLDDERRERRETLAGHDLGEGLTLKLPRPDTSLLVRYQLAP